MNPINKAAQITVKRLASLFEKEGQAGLTKSIGKAATRLGLEEGELLNHVMSAVKKEVPKAATAAPVVKPKPKIGVTPYAKGLQELQRLHAQEMPEDIIQATASALAKKHGKDPEQVLQDMVHHGKVAGTGKDSFTPLAIGEAQTAYARQIGLDPSVLEGAQMLTNPKGQVKIGLKLTPEQMAAVGTKQDTLWILAKNERDALKELNNSHFEIQEKVEEVAVQAAKTEAQVAPQPKAPQKAPEAPVQKPVDEPPAAPPANATAAPAEAQVASPGVPEVPNVGLAVQDKAIVANAQPITPAEMQALQASGKEITTQGQPMPTPPAQKQLGQGGSMVPMEQTIIPNEAQKALGQTGLPAGEAGQVALPNKPLRRIWQKAEGTENSAGKAANEELGPPPANMHPNPADGMGAGRAANPMGGLGIPVAAAGAGAAATVAAMNQQPQHALEIPVKYIPKIDANEQARRDALGPSAIPNLTQQQVNMDTVGVVTTKGGNFNIFKKNSASAHAFREAFAQAKEAGDRVFTFGGLRYAVKTK